MTTICYSPRQRRRSLRWLVLALLLASIAITASSRYRRQILMAWCELRFQYVQHRCLSWTAPPGTIAYREMRPVGMLMPECLRDYADETQNLDPNKVAAIFVHRRTSQRGNQYLVVVSFEPGRMRYSPLSGLHADAFPIYRYGCNKQRSAATDTSIIRAAHPPRPLVILVGEPDPSDSAHFTIDYLLGGQKRTINGRVDDEGHVELCN
jgi:hypothetical protein